METWRRGDTDTIRYGYDTMRCETIQCDTMLRETIRIRYGYDTITDNGYNTTQYDTIRCNTLRYATMRCDTMVRETIRMRYEYDTIAARCDVIREKCRYDWIGCDSSTRRVDRSGCGGRGARPRKACTRLMPFRFVARGGAWPPMETHRGVRGTHSFGRSFQRLGGANTVSPFPRGVSLVIFRHTPGTSPISREARLHCGGNAPLASLPFERMRSTILENAFMAMAGCCTHNIFLLSACCLWTSKSFYLGAGVHSKGLACLFVNTLQMCG